MATGIIEITNAYHNIELMNTCWDFAVGESFTDVQLITQEGRKVFAHKMILVSVSRMIRDILSSIPDIKDMITIHVPDIDYRTLRLVVNFLYIGSMRLNPMELENFNAAFTLLGIELFEIKQTTPGSTSAPSSNGNTSIHQQPQSQIVIQDTFSNRITSDLVAVQPNVAGHSTPIGFTPMQQNSRVVPVGNNNQFIIPNDTSSGLVAYREVRLGSTNLRLQPNDTRQPLQVLPPIMNPLPTSFISSVSSHNPNILQSSSSSTNIVPVSSSSLTGLPVFSQVNQSVQLETTHRVDSMVSHPNQHTTHSVPATAPMIHAQPTTSNVIIDLSADDDQLANTPNRRKRNSDSLAKPSKRTQLSSQMISNEIIDLDSKQ